MESYFDVFRKYAVFSGRARRREYWMFTLLNAIVMIVLAAISHVTTAAAVLYVVYILATFIPGIAVAFRRMHDTGHSAWWYLIGFIPLIGAIVLLVWLCGDSEPGDNPWGPNPKELPPVDAAPA